MIRRVIILILIAFCYNLNSLAQKNDSVSILYKENADLKKQITDLEKNIIRIDAEYKSIEKNNNTVLWFIGVVSGIIVTLVLANTIRSFLIAKSQAKLAGEEAKTEINRDFEAMKKKFNESAETNLNNIKIEVNNILNQANDTRIKTEDTLKEAKIIIATLSSGQAPESEPPNTEPE